MMLLKVGWRNIGRRKGRTLLTTLAMGVGVGLTLGAITLQTGLTEELFDEMVTDTLGHVQLHHPQYSETKRPHYTLTQVTQTLTALESKPEVALAVPRVFAFALAGGEHESTGALVMGVDPEREKELSEIHLEVKYGRWLKEHNTESKSESDLDSQNKTAPETATQAATQAADPRPHGPKEAVIGVGLARELKLEIGQQVALIGQDGYGSVANDLFMIVGLVESGSVELDRGGAWVPMQTLQSFLALEDQVHEIVVLGQTSAVREFNPSKTQDLAQLKMLITATLAQESILRPERSLLIETWKEANPSAAQLIESQSVGAYVMLMIVFLVSALGILNTLLMAVFERTRELGVLLAIGTSPSQVFAMVVSEAWMLAILASGVGLMIGGVFSFWLVEYGIDFSVQNGEGLSYGGVRLSPIIRGTFDWGWVSITLISLFVVTTITSLWPAWRAARVSPLEAMKVDT